MSIRHGAAAVSVGGSSRFGAGRIVSAASPPARRADPTEIALVRRSIIPSSENEPIAARRLVPASESP